MISSIRKRASKFVSPVDKCLYENPFMTLNWDNLPNVAYEVFTSFFHEETDHTMRDDCFKYDFERGLFNVKDEILYDIHTLNQFETGNLVSTDDCIKEWLDVSGTAYDNNKITNLKRSLKLSKKKLGRYFDIIAPLNNHFIKYANDDSIKEINDKLFPCLFPFLERIGASKKREISVIDICNYFERSEPEIDSFINHEYYFDRLFGVNTIYEKYRILCNSKHYINYEVEFNKNLSFIYLLYPYITQRNIHEISDPGLHIFYNVAITAILTRLYHDIYSALCKKLGEERMASYLSQYIKQCFPYDYKRDCEYISCIKDIETYFSERHFYDFWRYYNATRELMHSKHKMDAGIMGSLYKLTDDNIEYRLSYVIDYTVKIIGSSWLEEELIDSSPDSI